MVIFVCSESQGKARMFVSLKALSFKLRNEGKVKKKRKSSSEVEEGNS
jgi:hypothetical protein